MQQHFDIGSKVYSTKYGAGEVISSEGSGEGEKLTILFERAGEKQILPAFSLLEPLEKHEALMAGAHDDTVGRAVPAQSSSSIDDLKQALREVLREELGAPVTMMDRWRGGTMILRPAREGQKEKEIPLDDFFHKIVMLRDRLRVMEQKINAHRGLGEPDKIELQQYITRIYGTLTTFNVLFADREEWFIGQKSEA